jgi:hypothetical protein
MTAKAWGEPWWRPGEPAYLSFPQDRIGSMGDDVAEVAEMMRRPLDPHQLAAVDAFGSYGPGGLWSTLEACIVGPRQTTGKTSAVILPTVCHDLLTRARSDPGRCIWTSHRMKTTLDTFRDLKQIIEGSEEFSRRVARISDKDGDEGVFFVNGSWLEFAARSPGAGRGLASEIVVADEVLFLTSEMAGDLLPAMASKRNPRVLYAGSAAKGTSDQLHDLMRRGRAADRTLVYVEFRCPGSLDAEGMCASPRCDHSRDTPGCRLDDESLWPYGSPGLANGRCSITVVRALRRGLEPLEFAREMLGWEEQPDAGATTIPVAAWAARVDDGSRIAGPRALSFDVSPDRRSSAIGGAGPRADGDVHLALVDHRSGTSWLVPRLLELVERHDPVAVVVDGASPAATEIEALKLAGLKVRSKEHPSGRLVVLGPADQSKACGLLFDAIAGDSPSAWHRGDPILLTALTGAARRDIGDGGWAFGRKRSDVDICPIVAIAEAHYGLATAPAARVPLVAWR